MRECAVSLIVAAFISAAFDIVAPTSSYGKYVRMIMGIIMIIILITPILTLLNKEFVFSPEISYEQIDFNELFSQSLSDKVCENLEKKLKEMCPSEIYECEFTVEKTQEGFEITKVYVNCENIDEVTQILKNDFKMGDNIIAEHKGTH